MAGILLILSLGYPGEPTYVGVEKCKQCHEELVKKWERTAHAKAFERVKIKNAVEMPDCLKCHVTAFNEGGYKMADPNKSKYEAVQCEACHGPGSQHVNLVKGNLKNPVNEKEMGLVTTPNEETCKKMCHKKAHFRVFTFKDYWRLIEH
jgi:hypothetical protein